MAAISVTSGHPTGVTGGGYTGLVALQRGVYAGEVPQDTKFPSNRCKAATKSATAYHKKRLELDRMDQSDYAKTYVKTLGDDVVVLSAMPPKHLSLVSQDLVPREVAMSFAYEKESTKFLAEASACNTTVIFTPPGCMLGEDSVTTVVSEAMSTCPVNLDKSD